MGSGGVGVWGYPGGLILTHTQVMFQGVRGSLQESLVMLISRVAPSLQKRPHRQDDWVLLVVVSIKHLPSLPKGLRSSELKAAPETAVFLVWP